MPKKVKPQFQVKISNCGTNLANGTYPIWKDNHALKLLKVVIINVSKDFVGEENHNSALMLIGLELLRLTHKRYDELFPEYPEEKLKEIFDTALVLEGYLQEKREEKDE